MAALPKDFTASVPQKENNKAKNEKAPEMKKFTLKIGKELRCYELDGYIRCHFQ